jgi:hypothetical protein
MRRFLIAFLLVVPVFALAQRPTTAIPAQSTAEPAPGGTLPVRRVVLYKTGVGYFEHLGNVLDRQAVTIRFTSAQLNDVLKSLTVLDLGKGQITGISYNSVAPLEQRLGALRLPLDESTTQARMLGSLRGARVEITSGAGAVQGRLLSVEQRTVQRADDSTLVDAISIVTDAGELRSFELTSTVRVRILERDLRQEIGRYLDVVGTTREQDVRSMVVSTSGVGERPLFVSYVSEVPIWKSTYRLVLGSKGKPRLQGWAVIDNTIGEDWRDVELSLVAGAPQSFVQNISQPYYGRRPVVPLPSAMLLNPQTHQASMGDGAGSARGTAIDSLAETVTVTGQSLQSRIVGGVAGGVPAGRQSPPPPPPAAMPVDVYDQSKNVDPQAVAGSLGDLFEYRIKEPVSLTKNQSALVPIVNADIDAEKVSLWNRPSGSGRPLRAVWLTNATGLTLDGGSMTLIDGNAFAGEGLIDPLKPGEKRLLSYAADLGVMVSATRQPVDGRLVRLRARDGVITTETEERATSTYRARNENATATTLIVEHQMQPGWKLAERQTPVESTVSAQRFRVVLPTAQETVLEVREVKQGAATIMIGAVDGPLIARLAKSGVSAAALEQALKPVLDKKAELSVVERRFQNLQSEHSAIGRDQQRLRENMKALRGSDEEKQLLQRYTRQLDQQETRLETLQTEMVSVTTEIEKLRAELGVLVGNVSFELTP